MTLLASAIGWTQEDRVLELPHGSDLAGKRRGEDIDLAGDRDDNMAGCGKGMRVAVSRQISTCNVEVPRQVRHSPPTHSRFALLFSASRYSLVFPTMPPLLNCNGQIKYTTVVSFTELVSSLRTLQQLEVWSLPLSSPPLVAVEPLDADRRRPNLATYDTSR